MPSKTASELPANRRPLHDTLTQPLLCLLLVQVQGSPGYPVQYANALDCVRQMWAREGLRAFWRCALCLSHLAAAAAWYAGGDRHPSLHACTFQPLGSVPRCGSQAG